MKNSLNDNVTSAHLLLSLSDPGEDISGSLMNVVPMVSSFVPLSLKEEWEERDNIEIQREREREREGRGRGREGGREGEREGGREGGRVSESVCVCMEERRVRGWSCA